MLKLDFDLKASFSTLRALSIDGAGNVCGMLMCAQCSY